MRNASLPADQLHCGLFDYVAFVFFSILTSVVHALVQYPLCNLFHTCHEICMHMILTLCVLFILYNSTIFVAVNSVSVYGCDSLISMRICWRCIGAHNAFFVGNKKMPLLMSVSSTEVTCLQLIFTKFAWSMKNVPASHTGTYHHKKHRL